jgi:CIC family chloride channel protein
MSFGSSIQQLRLREHQLFLALTIVVGVLAGLSAVLFTVAIDWATRLFFGFDPSATRLFLVPVAVSLVTGILLAWVFPDVRGSGVPQTEAVYHLRGGVIPARVPLGKFVTGVLCVGSGHSMGREGPSVQIGAGLASVVGRWVPLSADRVKDLVPVGAAGALAAAFNTPVAAVLFALEEIIGDMNATLLGSTVVASVASVVVERSILGNEPCFGAPITCSIRSNSWRMRRWGSWRASCRWRSARASWALGGCSWSCRPGRARGNRRSVAW